MPILRKWEYNGAICGIWKVTETTDELRYLLTDKSFTPEFFSYKSYSRQIEFLAVRALIRELTGAEQRVLHYESGKPYLDGCKSKISISHTKGYVAVALHPEKETGIDIEYRSDRVKKVVTRFISDKEMSLIDEKLYPITDESTNDFVRVNMYLLFWSSKETIFKVLNAEGVDFIDHLQISSMFLSDKITAVNEFSEIGFSYGFIEAVELKTRLHKRIRIEMYVSKDFVCTYSVL